MSVSVSVPAAGDGVRILVVTSVHTPLDARIHHRQIRSLVAAGHRVTYVAPWAATRTPIADAVAGVAVRDVPRAVGRRRLVALAGARRRIAELADAHDVVLLHDPELVGAVTGNLSRLPPVVLDVHEDLPASLADRRWIPAPLRRPAAVAARRAERWVERRIDLILAEEAYASRFAGSHPVVPNLPWLPDDPPEPGSQRRVVHLGRLSIGRGTRELLAVGAGLAADGGPRLHLVGPADADVIDDVGRAHDRGEVTWHGFAPNDRALEIVRGSIAGLCLLHDLPNYRASMPTKVVEYLAHRVPAVTTPLSRARRIVEDARAGVVVPFGPVGVDAAITAVRDLARDAHRRRELGDAGHRHVAAHASWDAVAPRFVAYLESVAARR